MNQVSFSATTRFLLLLIVALRFIPCNMIAPQARAQGIVFNSVTPNQTTVAKWDKYEAVINLTASYTNQYDYNDIAIQATFTSPSGVQRTVDAFWMHDHSIDPTTRNLSPTADSGFRVRFTPDEPGQWSYVLSGRLQGGSPVTGPNTYTFTCSGTSATGKGYIRKTNSHYLKWDNGSQYIPLGENIPYPYSNIILDYEYYLNKTEPVGMNFIRAWMATWGFALEWTNTPQVSGFSGLKRYKQSAAKALDYLLDRGHTNGYAVMLCINYHNQILLDPNRGPEWQDNPYNTAKGGPCATPPDFFTNATAKAIMKNRLRYLVARWGYSGSLQSWELFNEVDNWENYSTNITQIDQWQDEMAGYLKSIDPNHLVTTSFGDEKNGNGTWNSAHIDFTQIHKYTLDERLPRLLSNLHDQRVNTYEKPTLTGEFGLSVYEEDPSYDPYGISLHNIMWATLFSGSMGSGVPWLWNRWVDEKNLYAHFATLAAYKDLVPFEAGNFRKVTATYSNAGPAEATITPKAQWGSPTAGDFSLDNEGELSPGADSLGIVLFGSDHAGLRKPPTFHVNYLQNGTFVLVTDTVNLGSRVTIYVDGVQQLDQPAQVRTTYTVNVPAGSHNIKIDNLGNQWAMLAKLQFLNAVGPFNMYTLKSADNSQAAGYILQRLYNFRYCLDNSNIAPPVVPAGALISIPGMNNGTYTVNFYSCAPTAAVAPAQPAGSTTATASNGTLSFSLPEVAWDIAFTATPGNTPPGPITSGVTVTPGAGWGAATLANFTINSAGVITPGTSNLGIFIYGSEANTQYRNPPTFTVNYAQAGYFEVRTAATISPGWPRVTIYVDGVKMLDQPAFINTSYVVTILPGPHNIKVDNLGGDWTQVDHYSFVPSLASPPPAPPVTANARTVTPGYPWGSPAPANAFALSDNGTLTPGASNLGMYVYGSLAHPDKRNPATINVTFPQAGYLRVNTGATVSQDGHSRVSIYVDGMLVADQVAFPNLPYVITVTAGTHNIKIDNLGGDWFLADTFVFDVLSP
jgi:hypothetical protein